MKLFHQLLVAPAALGLLAPIAINASEINVSGIDSYSSLDQEEEELFFDHNSFSTPLASTKSNEADNNSELFNTNFEAGSFSDTTVASQTAAFLLGATGGDVRNEADIEALQFNYYYGMSLDTSFDGDDNLNVVIEAGNTDASGGFNAGTILDFGTSAGDTLKVVDVNYSKSFGDLSLTVGDSLDASSQFAGACAYSGFTDHLSDCGTGLTAGIGGDVTVSSSYDIGNGFVAGFGVTGYEGSSSKGIFTEESADAYALQLAYAADSYGLAVSYSDINSYAGAAGTTGVNKDTTLLGFNGYYTFGSFIENISVGYETADPETGDDTTNWFAGVTTAEVGPGAFSLGLGTTGHLSDAVEETLAYEASYSWDLNDSTSMTVGGFLVERSTAGSDDLSGLALNTTFSF